MGHIVEAEAAGRLARAIISDVALYHGSELAAASPTLVSAIEEGRALFQQRVDPLLHRVFEEQLANSKLAAWGAPMAPDGYRDAQRSVPRAGPPAPEPPKSSALVFVFLTVTFVAAAIYYYFTWYRP